jgi:uncharacterized membrane protein
MTVFLMLGGFISLDALLLLINSASTGLLLFGVSLILIEVFIGYKLLRFVWKNKNSVKEIKNEEK